MKNSAVQKSQVATRKVDTVSVRKQGHRFTKMVNRGSAQTFDDDRICPLWRAQAPRPTVFRHSFCGAHFDPSSPAWHWSPRANSPYQASAVPVDSLNSALIANQNARFETLPTRTNRSLPSWNSKNSARCATVPGRQTPCRIATIVLTSKCDANCYQETPFGVSSAAVPRARREWPSARKLLLKPQRANK